jgi:hypothetical protein
MRPAQPSVPPKPAPAAHVAASDEEEDLEIPAFIRKKMM